MASGKALRRSNSSSRTNLLPRVDLRTLMNESPDLNPPRNGTTIELAAMRALERKAAHLVSGRRRRKKKNKRGSGVEEEESGRIALSGCLAFYGKAGGCRVGSCEGFMSDRMRRPIGVEFDLRCGMRVMDGSGLECLSHGVSDMFWRISSRRGKEGEQPSSCVGNGQFSLPDDVLEMCLVRLPLASLMASRLVCKKWRSLTTTAHFMRMRLEGSHQTPWLFLFGIMKNLTYTGEIYALDICLDRWHRVTAPALHGRFLFSVASIGMDLYVVGGCSSLNRHGPMVGRSPVRTHKGVFMFSPSTGLWFKAASMRFARSGAAVGVFEVGSSYAVLPAQSASRQEVVRQRSSRVRGVSDVYEDPHMCSVRRRHRDAFTGTVGSPMIKKKSSFKSGKAGEKRYALIVVGGHGSWEEPLDSGEIYDPLSNRWTQIAKLPADFGSVCSGAACGGVFYVYSEADKLAGYDLNNGLWVAIQTSHIPLHLREYHPRLVSCENRLFLVSVSWSDRDVQPSRREKAVRKMWELYPMLRSWIEVSRHPDAPMDRSASFVTDGNDIYGVEMFKVFGQALDFITACNVSEMEHGWRRVSREHATHEADISSCIAKTVAVLKL